jgi:hypothetical protein
MKKIRMGLESCEDVHDTTLRGDDYVDDEPRDSNIQTTNNPDNEFDDLITTSRVQAPSPTPAVVPATQVSYFFTH